MLTPCLSHEYSVGPKVIPTAANPHALTNDHLPVTLGHEFCGHLAHVPDGAITADGTPLEEGMPVMVDPRLNCHSCHPCKSQSTNLCTSWGFLGLHGAGGGGFSETVAVSSRMCYPLPKDMPLDHAVLVEPLAVARHALVKSGYAMGDFKDLNVLVIGGGPVGFAVLCNIHATGGAKNLFISEPAAARQKLVKSYATRVFNPAPASGQTKVPDACRAATGGEGVDLVFDCAGIPPGMRDGFSALKPKGTFVNVAGWETDFVIPFGEFMGKEITIRSTLAYDDKDFGDVVRDFVAGKFKGVEAMLTARISLEDIVDEGFEQLVNNKEEHSKIIVTPKTELLPRKRRNTGERVNGT